MTWVGWLLAGLMAYSSGVMFYRAGQGGYTKSANECLLSGVEMAVYTVLILAIGTGSL